ncbi:uncharacterized protein LOC109004770 [Juglans regia]|uniref:Uncharacterized protein LOC109004770 n=1 Tax=Juglans regia TaxID=51240 RepID=A0A6P9EGR0_JUGRE|nr:uncharacterized protein LOC109004770 [Juglans regia]
MESVEGSTPDFDILLWWKVNLIRYPILANMARDVLAIPISTVTSESAFSVGGRVLDSFRSSLAPTTVESLICTQNWLMAPSINYDSQDVMEDAESYKLETGFLETYSWGLTTQDSWSWRHIHVHFALFLASYLEDNSNVVCICYTVLLERGSIASIAERMQDYQVIAMVVLFGPKMKHIQNQVQEDVKKIMSS